MRKHTKRTRKVWCFNGHLKWKVFPHLSISEFCKNYGQNSILERFPLGFNESLLSQIVSVMTLSCTLYYASQLNQWFATSNWIVLVTHKNVSIQNNHHPFPHILIVLGILKTPNIYLMINNNFTNSYMAQSHHISIHVYPCQKTF